MQPVRVITSADGKVVWVTARGSDAVLGFAAAVLRTDPGHALVARVPVGEAPVGLALADDGRRLIVELEPLQRERGDIEPGRRERRRRPRRPASAPRPDPDRAFPREMAVIPRTNTLLVTDYLAERVQAVNLAFAP